MPVRYGGISKEDADKKFKYTVYRDDIKNKYYLKNNIPLLRISYNDINNGRYADILENFIQTVKD